MRVCFLGSGSSGNSFYLEGDNTRILIDAGFNFKVLGQRLSEIGVLPEQLDAILITHEHSDHICGLSLISRKWDVPVYVSNLCADVIQQFVKHLKAKVFYNGSDFILGDLQIRPFPLLHDTVSNSGFVINCGDKKVFYATDLGFVTSIVKERMKDTDLIVFESNHDRDMLINGKYPWYLKQRILGRQGHISNEESATALKEILNHKCKRVIFAHVSRENNNSDVLLDTHRKILNGNTLDLVVAMQDKIGDIYEV